MNNLNVRNCVGKKVVFSDGLDFISEGVVSTITGDVVKIGNGWYDTSSIVIKAVLSDNINESGNGSEQLVNG